MKWLMNCTCIALFYYIDYKIHLPTQVSIHPFTHSSDANGRWLLYKVPTCSRTHLQQFRHQWNNHFEKFSILCRAHGDFDMQTRGVGYQTSNLLINRQPPLPSELQLPPHQGIRAVFDSSTIFQ